MNLFAWLDDFFSLVYPAMCYACSGSLVSGEKVICTSCWHSLPQTGFHNLPENPVTRMFWGRAMLETGTALFYYQKGGKVQHLIHQLKYKNREVIGQYMGHRLGQLLSVSHNYRPVSCIVPVPLHAKRLRERGYNQSEAIGRGLAAAMGVPLITDALYRQESSQSQTRKRRFTRWENVEAAFGLHKDHKLQDKHILLLDDVITTGATMEACVQKLCTISGARIYVAALGVTL